MGQSDDKGRKEYMKLGMRLVLKISIYGTGCQIRLGR